MEWSEKYALRFSLKILDTFFQITQGKYGMWNQFIPDAFQAGLYADGTSLFCRAMTSKASTKTEIDSKYGEYSRLKGEDHIAGSWIWMEKEILKTVACDWFWTVVCDRTATKKWTKLFDPLKLFHFSQNLHSHIATKKFRWNERGVGKRWNPKPWPWRHLAAATWTDGPTSWKVAEDWTAAVRWRDSRGWRFPPHGNVRYIIGETLETKICWQWPWYKVFFCLFVLFLFHQRLAFSEWCLSFLQWTNSGKLCDPIWIRCT